MVQLAGEWILAEDIAPVRYFKKTATETVTSSAVLQNDDDFALIPFAANKVYRVEMYLAAASAAVGINTQWVLAGGVAQLVAKHPIGMAATYTGSSAAINLTRMDIANITTAMQFGTTGGWTGTASIQETFIVETTTSGTSGTMTLTWCQAASNGSGTSLSTSSFLIITEIEAG